MEEHMSIKHVKKYYRDVEKLYLELVSELNDMKDDFEKGLCTEDELNNLLLPVKGLEENYKRLSYVMYLLFQPNRDKKVSSYTKQNKELYDYFKNNNLLEKQELELEKTSLKTFKQKLKELKNESR